MPTIVRSPRRLASIAAAVAGVTLPGLAPVSAEARHFSCARAEGSTVVQTREARVFVRERDDVLIGCQIRRRGERPVRLGRQRVESQIFNAALGGRFLAFERIDSRADGGRIVRSAVEVWDLGRARRRFLRVQPQPPNDPRGLFTGEIVVTRSASVAWTTSDGRVLASERFRDPRTLEAGGADISSLALAADRRAGVNRVYWTVGGEPRTANVR